MRYLALAGLCVALAGCTEAVYMRNMAGMVATCGPYRSTGISSLSTPDRERQCITDYQRQGYERIPRP